MALKSEVKETRAALAESEGKRNSKRRGSDGKELVLMKQNLATEQKRSAALQATLSKSDAALEKLNTEVSRLKEQLGYWQKRATHAEEVAGITSPGSQSAKPKVDRSKWGRRAKATERGVVAKLGGARLPQLPGL